MAALQTPAIGLAGAQAPRSFRVQGRHPGLENADICGEYCFIRQHGGYPAYQNRTTGIVIRFLSVGGSGRWVMDRGGLRNTDVCVAFAEVQMLTNCGHPASPDLVWQVWDSRIMTHAEDPEVYAIDAPDELTVIGRAPDRENAVVAGKYFLKGVAFGRAHYHHQKDSFSICYNQQENRWMISDDRDVGTNICAAWANTLPGTVHPLDASLQWHFWEPSRTTFMHDPSTGVVDAPEVVTVLGRRGDLQTQNARINGAYQLAGVHEGKPIYVQPATQHVIRYSAKNDWWLIDCDGVEAPSLMSKCVNLLIKGDPDAAYNRCTAWARALKSDHPGHINLQWNVWEYASQQHKLDREVACTAAPLVLNLSGRDVACENADITGEYTMVTSVEASAVYCKPGTNICMSYSRQHNRWVIDRSGRQDSGVCVAYADCDGCSEYPRRQLNWNVFVSGRGEFAPDPSMCVEAPDVHTALVLGEQVDSMVGDLPYQEPAYCGMKREFAMENEFPSFLQGPEAKRARRTNQGGASWLGSLFGA